MSALRSAALVALAIGVAAPASAGTVLFTADKFDGDAGTSDVFNGNGNTAVRITGGPRTVSALAGGFALSDGIAEFVAWCLDIGNTLSIPGSGTPYHQTGTPFSNTTGALSGTTVGTIRALFETSYATLDLASPSQSAGFQLALWEILYETDDAFDLGAGSFRQTRTTGAALAANAQANAFLGALGGPVTQRYRLTFFESGTDQQGNQLSQNLVAVSPVPLPAAAGFLIAGLGALATFKRRRKI
ncbi:VPLPA-CTERM sorting domain-containing protein [Palleronia sp. KMU-117]|uniref:VPLPA-CTERM sorting domain-containing protein n=1 Tax=Palleronia sp. KMU-117 TaxID=3434108 RepID=UPI003D75C2FE